MKKQYWKLSTLLFLINFNAALAKAAEANVPEAKASEAKATEAPVVETKDVKVVKDSKDAPAFSVFGDIRHRLEQLRNENPDAGKNEKYEQNRIRARLGVKAQPTVDTAVEFRLATGSGGTSTNQNYGESAKGFRNYDFKLDRAFAKYAPSTYLNVSIGRMSLPFQLAGDNDLLFDTDLNFDGSVIGLDYKFASGKVFVRAGQFYLEETKDSQSSSDVFMSSGQIGGAYSVMDALSLGIVLSQHRFGGVKDHVAIVTGDFGGNSNAGSRYSYNYTVDSVGVDLTYDWTVPITVFMEQVTNSEADTENTAQIVGIKLGKLKSEGDWSVSVDSREIKKDSTLGILVDSDSYGGGTNGRSTRSVIAYSINKFFNVSVSNYSGKKNIQPTDTSSARDRWHFDLNFKF